MSALEIEVGFARIPTDALQIDSSQIDSSQIEGSIILGHFFDLVEHFVVAAVCLFHCFH